MDVFSLALGALGTRYPEFALMAVLVAACSYLFFRINQVTQMLSEQITESRRLFAEELSQSSKRITDLSDAVLRCNTSHTTEMKTVLSALTDFQLKMARDTYTKIEVDTRLKDVSEGIREILDLIRSDLSFVKERISPMR